MPLYKSPTLKAMNKYNVLIISDDESSVFNLKEIIKNYVSIPINIYELKCSKCLSNYLNFTSPHLIFIDYKFLSDFICFLDSNFEYKLSDGVQTSVVVCRNNDEDINIISNSITAFLNKPYDLVAVADCLHTVSKFLFEDNCKLNFVNEFLPVASVDRIDILKFSDILYCKAEGKYTTFFMSGGKNIVSSRNLGEYEKILPSCFIRVHHGYIINLTRLSGVIKKDGLYCELEDNIKIPVSKRKQEYFNKIISLRV